MVAGVDYSQTMVEQARKRNKSLIEQGHVEIKQGEVSQIPFDDQCFDKLFTVNTLYFWPKPLNKINHWMSIVSLQEKHLSDSIGVFSSNG